jgi:hypothetical protein
MNLMFYRGSFSRYSDFELEERVMKKKLDINKIDSNMFTPLSFLSNAHQHDRVFNLIEKKFDLINWENLNKILSLQPVLNSILSSNACYEKQRELIEKIHNAYPLNQIKVKFEDLEKLCYLYIKKDNVAAYTLFKNFLTQQHIEKINDFYIQKENIHYYSGNKEIRLVNNLLYDLNQAIEKNNEKIALNCVNVFSILIENNFDLCFIQEKESLYSSSKNSPTYNTLFSIWDNDTYLNSVVFLVQNLTFKDDLGSKFLEYWHDYKTNSTQFNFKLEKINESFYLDALNKKYFLNEKQIERATIMVIKNSLDFNVLNPYVEQAREQIEKLFNLYGNKDAFSSWQERLLLEKQISSTSVNKKIKI